MFDPTSPSGRAAIERARGALADERRKYDGATIPAHRGECVRTMYAVLRDALGRYGAEVVDQAGRDFVPNYTRA